MEGAGQSGEGYGRHLTPIDVRGRYRRQLVLGRGDVGLGPGYLYRPTDVLVAEQDVELVAGELREAGAEEQEPLGHGFVRFRFRENVAVPELLARLRTPRDGRVPRVGPNHVLLGQPNLFGGPFDFASGALEPPPLHEGEYGKGVVVGVVDTGLFIKDQKVEHSFLAGNSVVADPGRDAEELNANPADENIDDAAGHGTFIAGVIRQHAPGARVAVAQGLSSDGVGDEVEVVARIAELYGRHKPDILNLSLGGYTEEGNPPWLLRNAIRALPPEVVVVAAAGNDSVQDPFWPAAMREVVAVGALDCTEGPAPHSDPDRCGSQPASYSNRGWWVEASAVGDWVSTFVLEWDDPPLALPDGVTLPERAFRGWARWRGTSFAAPCVAGSLAAVMSAKGMTAREALDLLLRRPGLRRVPLFGAVLDLRAAISS